VCASRSRGRPRARRPPPPAARCSNRAGPQAPGVSSGTPLSAIRASRRGTRIARSRRSAARRPPRLRRGARIVRSRRPTARRPPRLRARQLRSPAASSSGAPAAEPGPGSVPRHRVCRFPRFEHCERQLRSAAASSSGAPRDIGVRSYTKSKGAHSDTPPPRPGRGSERRTQPRRCPRFEYSEAQGFEVEQGPRRGPLGISECGLAPSPKARTPIPRRRGLCSRRSPRTHDFMGPCG
jgi:hypothetical protein